MFLVGGYIDAFIHKFRSALIDCVIFTGKVDHGACFASAVYHKQRGDAGKLGNLGVIGTGYECA